MANVVKIELIVDEKGAVTGFRNLDRAGTQVQTTVKAVTTAGTQMGAATAQAAGQAVTSVTKLTQAHANAGAAAQTAGAQGAAAMKHVGDHALTSLDSVRLFRDEFGIHIPRSMEKAMASSQAVMTVLNGMQQAMLFAGSIGVVLALGTEVVKLGSEWLDTTKEVKAYAEAAGKAASQKLFDESDFDTASRMLQRSSAQIEELEKKKERYSNSSWLAKVFLGNGSLPRFTSEDDKTLANAYTVNDKETLRTMESSHKAAIQQIEDKANVAKAGKRVAEVLEIERKAQAEINKSNREYADEKQSVAEVIYARAKREHPELPAIPTAADPGRQEFEDSEATADAQKAAKRLALEKEIRDELRRITNEANDADLKGFRLLEAQKAEAYQAWVVKYGESRAAQSQIDRKFWKLEKEQREELERELASRARVANIAGLTGLPSIQARGANRLADIDADLAAGKYAAAGDRSAQERAAEQDRASARKETNQEIVEAERRFNETITELAASSTERQVRGFARIRAEGDKELTGLQRRFEEVYGKINGTPTALQSKGLVELNRGRSAVEGSVAVQTAELARKNAEDTERLEREAARRSLRQNEQRYQEIRDQYAEEIATYQRMLDQKELAAEDFDRRRSAAERKMNAELANEARAQRDRLAGMIEPFFRDPLSAIQHIGEQQAAKLAATQLMRFSGHLTGGEKLDNFLNLPGLPGEFGGGSRGAAAAKAVAQMTITASLVIVNGSSVTMGSSTGVGMGGGAGAFASIPGASLTAIPGAAGGWSTTSGSYADHLGFTSTGGPAVAASKAALGVSSEQAPIANGLQGGMSMAQNSVSLGNELFKSGTAAKLVGKAGAGLAKAAPALGAAAGLFSAATGNGGAGAALSGALSGAKIGAMLGGPIGAGIGAAAGAVLGFIGLGGASRAKHYFDTEVHPRITQDITQFGMGAQDYQSTYNDLVSLDKEARQQTKQWGMGGKREWDGEIHPAIMDAQKTLEREQKAGRSQYGMSAAQFHGGGRVMGFGDFATSPTEGFAHLKVRETVMHERASDTHGDVLQMMLAGATRAQVAAYYASVSPQQMAPAYRATMQNAAFGSGGHTFNNGDTYHINAIDTKSFNDALMANKHGVRAAQNASYAENSGGWD